MILITLCQGWWMEFLLQGIIKVVLHLNLWYVDDLYFWALCFQSTVFVFLSICLPSKVVNIWQFGRQRTWILLLLQQMRQRSNTHWLAKHKTCTLFLWWAVLIFVLKAWLLFVIWWKQSLSCLSYNVMDSWTLCAGSTFMRS